MEGYIDEYGHGMVRIGVIGRKMEIAVDAVIDTTLFLFLEKRKPVLKEKTMEVFLVKVFTEGKEVVGKAFLSKIRVLVKIRVILRLKCKAKKARITLTESRYALIGTKMFSYLEIDVGGKIVRIE